jgi:hypothetical protein
LTYTVLEGHPGELVQVIGSYDTLEEARAVVAQKPESRYAGTWKVTRQAATSASYFVVRNGVTLFATYSLDKAKSWATSEIAMQPDAEYTIIESGSDRMWIADIVDPETVAWIEE